MSAPPSAAADAAHTQAIAAAKRSALKDVLGVSPGFAAWGLVTGVAMVKSGLPVWAALLMTFSVYAASAQLAVLPLLMAGAPLWIVLATAFCVNLRFVIYSAQWRPYFIQQSFWRRLRLGYVSTDMSFALVLKRFPEAAATAQGNEPMLHYFVRCCVVNWIVWQVASVTGILAAEAVPTEWGLAFAGALALLALTFGLIKDGRMAAAAVVAAAVAVLSYGLPLKLHIIAAIVVAVAFGLGLDGLRPRKA